MNTLYQTATLTSFPKDPNAEFLHFTNDCWWHWVGSGCLLPIDIAEKYEDVYWKAIAKWSIKRLNGTRN